MYNMVKGRAEVWVYETKECECCGHIVEDDGHIEKREITVLLDVTYHTVEDVTEYLELHVERTTDPDVQILLRKWIDPPVIEELYPDLINRIVGAPVLFDVKPSDDKRPAYARLAKEMSMDKFVNSMAAVEVR